jgi:hypothetical protein
MIATASSAPAIVSTVLMPIMKAATWPVPTAVPVAGANPAARIATAAAPENGASGSSRPPLWASITSSTAATPTGRWNAARKQKIAPPRNSREASCQGST